MKNKVFLILMIILFAFNSFACRGDQSKFGPDFDGESTHEPILSDRYVLETISKSQTSLQSPRGILCRADDIIICDWEQHCLVVLDAEGSLLYTVGQQGNAPLEFLRPTGITQTENEIYVIDSGNSRVQILSHDWEYQGSFDLPVFTFQATDNFMDIAVASDGSIYLSAHVIPTKEAYIYRFNDNTVEIVKNTEGFYGMLASYDGVVYSLNSRELYETSKSYSMRSGRSWLKEVIGNKTIAEWPYSHSPSDFLFTGEVFYCYSGGYCSVDCFDASGVYLETLAMLPHPDFGMLSYAYIAQAADGSLWLGDKNTGDLYHITENMS